MNINELLLFHFSRNIDSSLVDYSVLCLQSTIIRIILHLTIQLFYKHLILLQASVLQQIIVFIQGQVSGSQASLQSQGTTFSGNNDYSIRHLQYSTCIDSAQKRCRSDHIHYTGMVLGLRHIEVRGPRGPRAGGRSAISTGQPCWQACRQKLGATMVSSRQQKSISISAVAAKQDFAGYQDLATFEKNPDTCSENTTLTQVQYLCWRENSVFAPPLPYLQLSAHAHTAHLILWILMTSFYPVTYNITDQATSCYPKSSLPGNLLVPVHNVLCTCTMFILIQPKIYEFILPQSTGGAVVLRFPTKPLTL